MVYYDSLLGDNRVCLTALLDWLVQEAKDKKGMQYNVSDWKRLTPKVGRGVECHHLFLFTCMECCMAVLVEAYSTYIRAYMRHPGWILV